MNKKIPGTLVHVVGPVLDVFADGFLSTSALQILEQITQIFYEQLFATFLLPICPAGHLRNYSGTGATAANFRSSVLARDWEFYI